MSLACNDPSVGPKGWKGTGELVQDNIKIDLQEMKGVGCTDWNDVVQDRNRFRAVVNTVMNLQFT